MVVFQCNDNICADAETITDAKPDETDVQDDEFDGFDGLTFTVEGVNFKMVRHQLKPLNCLKGIMVRNMESAESVERQKKSNTMV